VIQWLAREALWSNTEMPDAFGQVSHLVSQVFARAEVVDYRVNLGIEGQNALWVHRALFHVIVNAEATCLQKELTPRPVPPPKGPQGAHRPPKPRARSPKPTPYSARSTAIGSVRPARRPGR